MGNHFLKNLLFECFGLLGETAILFELNMAAFGGGGAKDKKGKKYKKNYLRRNRDDLSEICEKHTTFCLGLPLIRLEWIKKNPQTWNCSPLVRGGGVTQGGC